jgi:xylulokinase
MTSFLGIDVGTSSVKAVLLDPSQAVLAEASLPLTVSRPKPLWSEQDPEDWWQATLGAVAAVRKAAPEAFAGVAAIGLSGQMHGAVLLDGAHQVLRPAIIWNDGRSEPQCAELLRRVPDFTTRAANIPMPGFTAPKLVWVAEHEPEVFAKTRLVLLPKDYVRLRLTGAAVSEMSDAAGTLWLDVGKRAWDDTLLAACGLDRSHMPSLVEGSEISANLSDSLATEWGLAGRRIPVAGGGGDNAASAVGIGAVRTGEGFLSLGTSGVLFSVTDRLAALPERTLHAFCHALPGRWHGMAVVLAAASALSWVAGVTGHADDIAGLVAKAEAFAADRGRREYAPLFLPYLTGERTPYNDASATGMFQGLRAEHGADAMAYAVLEGVAFGFADGLDVFNAASLPLTSCLLVGGGSRSAFWTQMIADVLQVPLDLPSGAELGAAFGAARLGMLAAGAGSEAEICTRPPIRRTFTPDAGAPALYHPRLARFRALYAAEKTTRGVTAK